MSQHLIVTIARQHGSGGREIGMRLGELLGCKIYGRELIAMSAEQSNMSEEALRRVDETAAGSLLYTLAMGSSAYGVHPPLGYHMPLNDKLFFLQSELIRKIAERENAVFIGRCADYVLRSHSCMLSVFVYADEKCRVRRIMEREQLPENKAMDIMNKVDHRRASYYNFYTGQKWGRYENYSLAVNSSVLGIDDTAKMIADFALSMKYKKNKQNTDPS